MAKLVNLTPHDIVVKTDTGTLTIPPSGTVARVEVAHKRKITLDVEGHATPFYAASFGDVVGLPDSEEGTFFIVSAMVKAAKPTMTDLVSPGPLIRDDSGKVVGCDGFVI